MLTDDPSDPEKPSPPPDHIGVLLWQAGRLYVDLFTARLRASGYPEITFALGNVLALIHRQRPTRVTEMVTASRATKQAIHQSIETLARLGLIEQQPAPNDRRGRLVRFTRKGQAFLQTADRIKRDIEGELQAVLQEDIGALKESTRSVVKALSALAAQKKP